MKVATEWSQTVPVNHELLCQHSCECSKPKRNNLLMIISQSIKYSISNWLEEQIVSVSWCNHCPVNWELRYHWLSETKLFRNIFQTRERFRLVILKTDVIQKLGTLFLFLPEMDRCHENLHPKRSDLRPWKLRPLEKKRKKNLNLSQFLPHVLCYGHTIDSSQKGDRKSVV